MKLATQAQKNLLFAIKLIKKMSVPGLFGDLHFKIRDGKLADLMEAEKNTSSGSPHRQKVVFQKRDSDEELQAILDALFDDYGSR